MGGYRSGCPSLQRVGDGAASLTLFRDTPFRVNVTLVVEGHGVHESGSTPRRRNEWGGSTAVRADQNGPAEPSKSATHH